MITFFSIMKPRAFATVRNLLNVLNQSSLLIIIACGLTAVVIIGDFDMSVAITASFSGVLVTGLMVKQNLPIWFAIICTIAICAFCADDQWAYRHKTEGLFSYSDHWYRRHHIWLELCLHERFSYSNRNSQRIP